MYICATLIEHTLAHKSNVIFLGKLWALTVLVSQLFQQVVQATFFQHLLENPCIKFLAICTFDRHGYFSSKLYRLCWISCLQTLQRRHFCCNYGV